MHSRVASIVTYLLFLGLIDIIKLKNKQGEKNEKILIIILLLFLFSSFLLISIENVSAASLEKDFKQEGDRGSLDASYILSSQTYSITPWSEFTREPEYGLYDFSNIHVGDIIYESETIIGEIGHCAIVSDVSHYYCDNNNNVKTYIQTIEAVLGGVQYGFLDDRRILEYGTYVCNYYVANSTQKQGAVNFCASQLGKGYWVDTDSTPIDLDGNQLNWYCSELVFAAYYNATNSLMQVGVSDSGHVFPSHIYNTWQTVTRISYDSIFLKISIASTNPRWTIHVLNNTGDDKVAEYNTKMCYFNDAKYWTNLYDKVTFYLPSASSTDKRVYEVIFAKYITFSYEKIIGNVRYRIITYANNLSNNGTMSVHYNYVKQTI